MIRLCGADTPVREKWKSDKPCGKRRTIFIRVSRAFAVLSATLQEIFDESAYRRFLMRANLQSSTAAYAMFLKENEHAQSRRPRCC